MEKGGPVERFVTLIKFWNKHDLNLGNCRGQSYDNASAISGIYYTGLQAKVMDRPVLCPGSLVQHIV